MSPFVSTVRALVWRDLLRFVRQRSRVVGALAQPLILWALVGAGLAGTFRVPGAAGLDYQEYFFPGILGMVVLFAAIFGTMSVIEDRHEGFLQAVLTGPGGSGALAVGKILGGSAVAVLQGLALALLAPLAGFDLLSIDWPMLMLHLALLAASLTALGVVGAWLLDSVAGYHAVMMVVLFPLWMVSGAMFPPATVGPVLGLVMRLNPLTYAGEGLRRALYGGELPPGALGIGGGPLLEVFVPSAFALLATAAAVFACRRRP